MCAVPHTFKHPIAFHPRRSHSFQIRKLRPRDIKWQNQHLNPDRSDLKPCAELLCCPVLSWRLCRKPRSSGWCTTVALVCVQHCCVEAAMNRLSALRAQTRALGCFGVGSRGPRAACFPSGSHTHRMRGMVGGCPVSTEAGASV